MNEVLHFLTLPCQIALGLVIADGLRHVFRALSSRQ